MRNRTLMVLVAVLALVLGSAGAFALAAGSGTTATCTHNPAVTTTTTGDMKFKVVCKVPAPPPSTVTVTADPTTDPTPTPTPDPTPTPTPDPTPTPTPTPEPGGAPFLPYHSGSYYMSAPGPENATLTAQMQNFVSTFVDQKNTPYPLLRGTGSNNWGMVYEEGNASDPVWHLTGSVPADAQALVTAGFHAPESLGSELTGTSDSPFVVMDMADHITVWGGKASVAGDHLISVSAAGYFEHDSNGLDRHRPESDSTVNNNSRGRIPDTMVVRKDAMDYAIANHTDLGYVLEMFWSETDSSAGVKFPMTGAEGGKAGWGAEGQRIAISPSVDLSTRNCSPVAYVIALTLQRHGAYIGDNAGGGAGLKMQNGAFPSTPADALKGCVTWADFIATD